MNLTTPCTSLKFNSTSEILAMSSNCAENACKLVHIGSMSVFSNFPLPRDNQQGGGSLNLSQTTSSSMRIPQSIDFSLNSGYFTIGNQKGIALLYRLINFFWILFSFQEME
jgi:U3 small nucleolar RNA-associated protein 18